MNQFDNTVDTQVLEQTDLADENARLDEVNPEYTGDTIRIIDPTELKQAQYEVIKRTNPMTDDYHVGIRSADDIKTFAETINDDESFVWGDYSREDARRDLAKNEITIYSSYPIENGVFVSTSRRQAQEYAGGRGAKVYERTVPLDYVAWINGDEGQFAITDVVGKKRTVYNSNGERIAKSEPALRNFWNWFGDSKVVDEDGRPLVVYHGTDAEFDTFARGEHGGTYGTGIYFGRKSTALRYGNRLLFVYLKIENPFVPTGSNGYRDLAGVANEVYQKKTNGLGELVYDDDIINWYLQDRGFDGIIDSKYIATGANEFVVFEQPKFAPTTQEKETFLSDLKNKQIIRLGKLPSVYQNIGINSADVKTKQTIIEKATIDKHNVPDEVVEQLPELFANPQIVFKSLDSSTNPDAFVSVVDAFDKSGRQLIVILSPTNKSGGYHLITSFYGRDNIQNMIDTAVKENKIRYVRDKNIDLLAGHNAYLSQVNNNIKYKDDIVNPQIKSTENRGTFSSDTGNIYHQRTQANRYYDAELKVIILGRNMNTMTLPRGW